MDRRKFALGLFGAVAAACAFKEEENTPENISSGGEPIIVNGGVNAINQPLISRHGRQMQEDLVYQIRDIENTGLSKKRKLKTVADVLAYQADINPKINACLGPFPTKTPLNEQITGTLIRSTYRIEKVLFESRPNFIVSANLYIPNKQTPSPGVVGLCGHDGKGKHFYQDFAQRLVKLGYVCLMIDAISQGERSQLCDPECKTSAAFIAPVSEHMQVGRQLPLVGQSMANIQTWDAIRAVDYLSSRPEVDSKHIGVTGNSGGGTQATWLTAVDKRITMSAPSCFITTFRRNCENELFSDHEQLPPRALAFGLDIDDFLAAYAPNPLMLLGKLQDYFDVRGFMDIVNRLFKIYTILGFPQNLQYFIGTGTHGFTNDLQTNMIKCFSQVTGLGMSLPSITWETEADLRCTTTGNVIDAGSLNSVDLLNDWADKAKIVRGNPTGEKLKTAIKRAVRLPTLSRAFPPESRVHPVPTVVSANYPKPYACVYAVETITRPRTILVPTYYLNKTSIVSQPDPVPVGSRAILYVANKSADKELGGTSAGAMVSAIEPLVKSLIAAEPDVAFFVCDLRGVGESTPIINCVAQDDFYAIHDDCLDTPSLGKRVWDLLRVIDYLGSLGYTQIHLAGQERGAIVAALAGVLEDRVVQVTLKNSLNSYDAVARVKHYQNAWPQTLLCKDVLNYFDLPDCYTYLQNKGLTQIDIWGPWLALKT